MAIAFVAEYEVTSFITAGASKSVDVTVAAGDTLVVVGITPDAGVTLGTPSGGGLTYSLEEEVSVSAYTRVAVWTAPAPAGQTFTLSITRGGDDFMWGFNALRYSGVGSIGASAKTNIASGAPSLDLTTTAANSAIVVGNGDWVPVDGATRTWRTPSGSTAAVEQSYAHDPSNYTAYIAYHLDAGSAGSKTVGLSGPTGQKYSIVAVELIPATSSTVTPTGIASTSAMGTPTVLSHVVPPGIASTAAVGTPTILSHVTLTGIASTAAVGTPAIQSHVSPSGIASTAAVGAPIISAESGTIFPTGIGSTAQVSSPVITKMVNGYRLIGPRRVVKQVFKGSQVWGLGFEDTVFGDENGLFTSREGSREIPFGTKYVWAGGHDNTTTDPAIRALWLAHGFTVEEF